MLEQSDCLAVSPYQFWLVAIAASGHPNVFIPKVWMLRDKTPHHLHTFPVIEHFDGDSRLSKQMFGPEKIAVLANDDGRNAE